MKITIPEIRARLKVSRESLTPEQLAFRVFLLCTCANDGAYGYGEDIETARQIAQLCLRRDHNHLVKVREEVIEKAVQHDGGWHYEVA